MLFRFFMAELHQGNWITLKDTRLYGMVSLVKGRVRLAEFDRDTL